MDQRQRLMLQTCRRALIAALNAIEDSLGMERTVPPKAQRRACRRGSVN